MYSHTKLHNHILNGLRSLVSNKVSFVARVFFPSKLRYFQNFYLPKCSVFKLNYNNRVFQGCLGV